MEKERNEPGERSPFYRLVREITGPLVGAQGEGIDTAVDDCLRRMGEYFGVDAVSLGGITKSGELTPLLRVWGRLPPIDKSLVVDPSPGPEMVAQFCREGSFVYGRLEDLDEFPQFREHTRLMGAVAAVFWMHRDLGSHVEGMAISSPDPTVWPDDIVDRVGVIGEAIFNALHRRRAELKTERLLKFEYLVAEVAARFVDLPPEQVDETIVNSLGQICECLVADMGTVYKWNGPDKSTLSASHEWCAEAIDAPCFSNGNLSREYPWLAARLREGTPLLILQLHDFPVEAVEERAMCERVGIQSIAWVPFLAATGSGGYMALATVNRPELSLKSFTPQIAIVGNVFANAMNRQRVDLELRYAHEEIRNLKDRIEAENLVLREEVKVSSRDGEIVGKSLAFRDVLHQAAQVGRTDSTVLLLGETGTGKGLIARRIHECSKRKDRPLITVNCAALPGSLIESELFGHEKGAFTGAISRKIGRFELADGGTIFLDEIGDLPIELQSKLLRVLQEHEFERLGSSTTRTVDTRVISATNRNIEALIEEGAFRPDLYYRLGVFPIRIPSLSERRDDIPLLVWFFVTMLQQRLGKTFKTIPQPVMDALVSYDWPGNVRELRNIVERAMILSHSGALDLDSSFLANRGATATETSERQSLNLEEVERMHILRVLEMCDWKVRGKNGAAERLGLNRSTLHSRMKKLGIQRPAD